MNTSLRPRLRIKLVPKTARAPTGNAPHTILSNNVSLVADPFGRGLITGTIFFFESCIITIFPKLEPRSAIHSLLPRAIPTIRVEDEINLISVLLN